MDITIVLLFMYRYLDAPMIVFLMVVNKDIYVGEKVKLFCNGIINKYIQYCEKVFAPS